MSFFNDTATTEIYTLPGNIKIYESLYTFLISS